MIQATPELREATVAIVGMGLVGGSLGRALRGACAHVVGVVEPGDDATATLALELQAMDEPASLREAALAADVLVFATPVRTTIALLEQVAPHVRPGALVTDVGGSKAAVVQAMDERLPSTVAAVGGHPMRGGTTGGVGASRPDLFEGARWALCPVDSADDDAVVRAAALVEAVRADPIIVEPAEHDRAVALVSHLPRVLATTLEAQLAAWNATDPLPGLLAGRGWEGATRLAHGDDTMWSDVLATNAHEVAGALRDLARRLAIAADSLNP